MPIARSSILRVGLAVLAAGAGASVASAEVLFSDSTLQLIAEGQSGARTCKAVLLPAATLGGERAPRLAFETAGGRVSLGIDDAGSFGEPTLVQNNQRRPFVPLARADAKALQASETMKAIAARRPFFITARLGASGDYVSSRYENVDFAAVLARVEQNCGINAEELAADTQDRLKAEASLGLSGIDLTHIRWVLARKYGAPDVQPAASPQLLPAEREYLTRYAADRGLPASKYLTRASSSRLLGETFEPVDPDPKAKPGFQKHGQWVSFFNNYGGGSRGCAAATKAVSGSEASYWWIPYLYLEAYAGSGRGKLAFDLAFPNPFNTGRSVEGFVDGERFALRFDGAAVKPTSLRGGVNDAMIRAIKSGHTIEIAGTSKVTGKPLTLKFSATGFSAAFNRVMTACKRPDLRQWLG